MKFVTNNDKSMKNWKVILQKLKKRREENMRAAELATKREEEKRRKEERDFRLLLRKDATRTRQLLNGYQSKISRLEKKLDRIIKKNKLKS